MCPQTEWLRALGEAYGAQVTRNPEIGQTVEAVGRLVPALQARGFKFETVTQLLCPTN